MKGQQLGFYEKTDRQQDVGLPLISGVVIIFQPPVPDPRDTGNLGEAPALTPGLPEVPTPCPAVHIAEQAPPDVVLHAAVDMQPPPPTCHLRVTAIVVFSAIEGVGTLTVPDPSHSITSGEGCCENHPCGGSCLSC